MKYSLIFSLFIVSIVGCQNEAKIPNEFKTDKDTIKFGAINYKDTLNTLVKIFNESKSVLKILDIESSCGCTSFLIKDSTVAGFDSTQFAIKYIPSDSNDSGRVIKRLTIRTNAKTAFKNLVIIGDVKK